MTPNSLRPHGIGIRSWGSCWGCFVYLTILQSCHRLGKRPRSSSQWDFKIPTMLWASLSNKQGRKAFSRFFRPSCYSCLRPGSYIQGNYKASIIEASNGKAGDQTRLSRLNKAFGAQLFPAGFFIPCPFSTKMNQQEAVRRLATHWKA